MTGTKEQIDERLRAAHKACGLADMRGTYRERLRGLRATDENAFRKAMEHYERDVEPRILDGEDVIDAWIDYGAHLGAATCAGRLVSVDASGRSRSWHAPYEPGTLVLFVPGEAGGEVLAVAVPVAPSPAQQATVTLLVDRKLALQTG